MPSCLLSARISALACFIVDSCGSAFTSPSSLLYATCGSAPPVSRSSMQRSTTAYHWHRSASAGASACEKSRPAVSSSHFADLNPSPSIEGGLASIFAA